MGNPSRVSHAPGGARGAQQLLIVIFERDESLAALLLGQLRAQGYEGRSARTPVEVFDLIARYPVRLALVNLGQAATSRREFWVALDAQRLGRGVQVITYRYVVPGVEPDVPDGSGRPDVEVRGPQGMQTLIEAVRAKLPPPPPPALDSSFLLGSRIPGLAPDNQPPPAAPPQMPSPIAQPQMPVMPPVGNLPEYTGRQQSIAGVLNLSRGVQAGQPPEFMPLNGSPGASMMPPAESGWKAEVNRTPPIAVGPPVQGPADQRPPQWMNGHAELPAALPAESRAPGWPSPAPAMEAPGASQMNGASFQPSVPMGDLAALSDAINALAAAGAAGYQQAAAAYQQAQAAAASASQMNGAQMDGNETVRWNQGQRSAMQEMSAMARGGNTYPVAPPPDVSQERYSAGSVGSANQMQQAGQPPARNAAETLYMGQQAFADLGRGPESSPQQDTRSRTLAGTMDDYEYARAQRVNTVQNNGNRPSETASRRLPDEREPMAASQPAASQHQMLAPIAATGQIERSLGNVLVEGQLVSQQRLEVAMGIQRLLRGVDIDYRLGEVLLTFKFLTRDQLLAALLVSRGLVSPAQVASIGRIKQELHAIGMEYDLENLLILFRMLSSEQLREIRSELS